MVISHVTDQVIHLQLAMATGAIPPAGDKVKVTVRQRKNQGVSNFVDVNHVYSANCDTSDWAHGGVEPSWLTSEANRPVFRSVLPRRV